MANRFQQAMRLMRNHDAQTQEDGFHQLRPYAARHLDELITEFNNETAHGLRCWLLELIGEAHSEQALPVLVEQLHGEDESLRSWAVRGLEKLDTRPARRQIHQARATGLIP
ncbi:HEAT repeat domain-containing protein [Micromonospora profundi]|uniref:HEAT repeat domain-containing protein n=1 Tax=Micromonospora profundi TaxID=1420889 RepID=A0AAJ6L265_9ACTN|nr:HEAT repeat domain-containing protein [Micromonospora profundi]WLS45405.1 HEAT repeat domain-containing protein [Micromonospora profundi]